MKTIWKYPFSFPAEGSFSLNVPRGALPRAFADQQGELTVWLEVDTERPVEPKQFYLRGTG